MFSFSSMQIVTRRGNISKLFPESGRNWRDFRSSDDRKKVQGNERGKKRKDRKKKW